MKAILFSLAVLSAFSGRAQRTEIPAPAGEPMVIVHKDARLDALISRQQKVNLQVEKENKENQRSMKGFRVQIINFKTRDEVIGAKTRIYQAFPELNAYINYSAPSFRLRVGDFKTSEEAKPYKDRIAKMFSNSVYTIPDVINLKPEKNKEEEEN